MLSPDQNLFAFDGAQRVAVGSTVGFVQTVSAYLDTNPHASILIFDADTGKQIDLNLRSSVWVSADTKPVGRPKLGVVAKEITLLPRHWDWLAQQPGGASVTIRKLVEAASKDPGSKERQLAKATAAYNFMHAVAGDLPGFEEASRLLFAKNIEGLSAAVASWPGDIGDQVLALAGFKTLITWS